MREEEEAARELTRLVLDCAPRSERKRTNRRRKERSVRKALPTNPTEEEDVGKKEATAAGNDWEDWKLS
eukprot:746131-Hanusia_phi.AAC.2